MKKLIFSFLLFIFPLFVFVSTSYAKVIFQEKGMVTISSGETINDDLFIGAESVEIFGTVNGDVYVGAGTVEVSGTINGDLLVGGGTVNLTGKVKDDVYIGGGEVIIQSASIGDSLLVGAGTLNIDKESSIGGSLLTGAGTVRNKASVGRNFFAGAGTVYMDSSVGGEVRVGAGDISVGENTSVAGDFSYMIGEDGKTDLVLPSDSVVLGEVIKLEPSASSVAEFDKAKADFISGAVGAKRSFMVISFLGALLVGFIVIKMKGGKMGRVVSQVRKSLLPNLGIGFLILVLTVPLAIIVMITGVGASLSMIVLAIYGIAVYMAKLVSSMALGTWLSDQFGWKKMTIYANFVLGLLIFYLLKNITVVAGITTLLFTSVGLGAFFKLKKSKE